MILTAIRPFILKESRSFVFSVNNIESDGKVYVFNNMELLDIEKHQENVIEQPAEIEEKNQEEE